MLGDELPRRGRGCRASTTTASSSPTRCRRGTSSAASGSSSRSLCSLSYFWQPPRPRAASTGDVRGLGRRRTSASGSTTRSSAPTPRRCGASRAPRSRPSGRRSGSRTSRFWKALLGRRCISSATNATTLIEEFHYPRLGPGQMWEACRQRVEERGIPVHLNHRAHVDPPRRTTSSTSITVERGRPRRSTSRSTRVLSTHPAQRARPQPRPASAARTSSPPRSGSATARSASSRS